MLNWFLDLLPWYVWLVLAIGGIFLVYRFFGAKVAGAVAAIVGAVLLYKTGRESGRTDEREKAEEKDEEHAEDIREDAADARAASDRRNADPDGLRKPDGFERD